MTSLNCLRRCKASNQTNKQNTVDKSMYQTTPLINIILTRYICFYIHMEKVMEHLVCYACKLWTKVFLRSDNVKNKIDQLI